MPQARLDHVVAQKYPELSRSQIRDLIAASAVTVSGIAPGKLKPSMKLEADAEISVELGQLTTSLALEPCEIHIEELYRDDHVVVLNKPAGLAMHPQKGGVQHTVANALLARYGQLPLPPAANEEDQNPLAAGIVHRLDADTSGVVICALSELAMQCLKSQFRKRQVAKLYLAIVRGRLRKKSVEIDASIERDPQRTFAMRARKDSDAGHRALTSVRQIANYGDYSLIEAEPQTGRTHQIRVHLSSHGAPVLGDRFYGGNGRKSIRRSDLLPEGFELESGQDALVLERQALHAALLEVEHPKMGHRMRFCAPLPHDMVQVLEAIQRFDTLA